MPKRGFAGAGLFWAKIEGAIDMNTSIIIIVLKYRIFAIILPFLFIGIVVFSFGSIVGKPI